MRVLPSACVVAVATVAIVCLSAPSAYASSESYGGCIAEIGVRNPHVFVNPDPSLVFVPLEGEMAIFGTGFYAGLPGKDIVLTCTIMRYSTVVATYSSTPSTGVAVVPPVVAEVSAAVGDQLYLCSDWMWTDPDGTTKSDSIECSLFF